MSNQFRTNQTEFPQLMLHVLEIIIPYIGECLGDDLDLYLRSLKKMQDDPDTPDIRKKAALLIMDLLPNFRDYKREFPED